MKKAILILLGAAALGIGLFVLFKLTSDLPYTRRDPFILVVLGMVLTLLLGGAWLVFAGIRALSHRDWSPGKWTRVAFYLVVLDAAALLALPHFVKHRTVAAPNACVAQQKQIDGAKSQWAMEHRKIDMDRPTVTDLTPYLIQKQLPVCERGGTYVIGTVGEKTICTAHPGTN
ncbi:MAG: hypothetical protein K0Q55_2284 [Verrucomicrobia bacterium]|jgi:hypothetical protein|nr:hypothetical protein [Verrucomicrobiota bacterium]